VATRYATAAGAGAKDGAAWASAFGAAELRTWLNGASPAAGDVIYVAAGTYDFATVGAIAAANDGTATAPITLIGTTGENTTEADGDSRPLWTCGGNAIAFDNYWKIAGLRLTGTATGTASLLQADLGSEVRNCKAINTGTGKSLYLGDAESRALDCELSASAGIALSLGGGYNLSYRNRIYGSATGITGTWKGGVVVGCEIVGCTTGITVPTHAWVIDGNVIYGAASPAGTGISFAGYSGTALNNILEGLATAFSGSNPPGNFRIEYNGLFNNTTNASAGLTLSATNQALSASPFVDAGNGDFRALPAVRGLGWSRNMPGRTIRSYIDPGAYQRQDWAPLGGLYT
jgi:hypothetical protein